MCHFAIEDARNDSNVELYEFDKSHSILFGLSN